MLTHEMLPGRLWLRGKTNSASRGAKAKLAAELGLTWVVAFCPQADYEWEDTAVTRYCHWPFADGKVIPPWIGARAWAIAEEIERGGRVLVYCNAGRNRSALVAALVIEDLTGCSGGDAVRQVQERRPGSLVNPAFLNYMGAAAA